MWYIKSYTLFFFQATFFFPNSACCLIFPRIQLQMLLIAQNHHHTEIHFIFSIFVSMSWPSSIYVISMWFIFRLIFIIIKHIISLKQAHLFFVYFFILILDDNMNKESESLSSSKVQPHGVSQLLLTFSNFSLVLLKKETCTCGTLNVSLVSKQMHAQSQQ